MLSKMFVATASKKSLTNASARAIFTLSKPNARIRQQMLEKTRFSYLYSQASLRMFSNEGQRQEQSTEINIDSVEPEPIITQTEKKEFKAETRKLLDIVAKSIYTDKEVFLRELMSNCSDALEKQRYSEISGAVTGQGDPQGLYINVTTNEKERTLTIFDSGIGMSREEVTENLGTIAKSGSQEFMRKLQQNGGKGDSSQALDSIIGQFGVGFYSTFIVADSVEVFTKSGLANDGHGVRWVSDGSGEYEVSTVDNLDF